MPHPRYYPVLAKEIARMQQIMANGLPQVYVNFDEFLADYFADFAWTDEAMFEQITELKTSPEWVSLAAQIKSTHGFDFPSQLTLARSEVARLAD